MQSRAIIVALFLSLAAALALPAQAQSSQASGTAVEFTFAPYLLMPTMAGDLTLRGRKVGVDLGPGEIFDNLETGFMGYFRADKGKWAVAFDVMYMNLEKAATVDVIGGSRNVSLGMQQGMYEFTAFYEVRPWMEFLFGARINTVDGSFTLVDVGVIDDGHTWVDPIVGAQLRVPDLGRWLVAARVDIGGFGVGSKFAWQVYPTAGYEFVDWFTLVGGYRVLSMDYEDGTGTDEFAYDMVVHGPYIGGAFRF